MFLTIISFLLFISSSFSFLSLNETKINNLFGIYDWKYGEISLWHSEASYCDPSTFLTRTYKGVLNGFIPTYHIYEKSHGTEGYIGYTPSQQTIYVVFRGSAELQNWLDNIDSVYADYPLCSGCQVHRGFYSAEQDSIVGIISEVKKLRSQFPSYKIIVTGHSLGGALATLTSMDLLNAGFTSIRLFTFGSPRVGDSDFAAYVSSKLNENSYRVTHNKDMVVHVPTHIRFMHIIGEYYQSGDEINLISCTGNEDINCSYQWRATNVKDHLNYLGVELGESGCSAIL